MSRSVDGRRGRDRRRPFADASPIGTVHLPAPDISPVRALVLRLSVAVGALLAAALVVHMGRTGYADVTGTPIGFGDALYYATVSLSTTGYGDIVPVTDTARLTTTLVITPLRVLFLIVLIGTTLELLTERSRQSFRIQRWRSRTRGHTVVVGYGTTGRAAVQALLGDGAEPASIVAVDTDRNRVDAASAAGLVAVVGDATRSNVLRLAGLPAAAALVVATNRDDTALLVTLTARHLSPKIRIVAAVREAENLHLMRRSGADCVVVSEETAGRLLGVATNTPRVVDVVEDLITPNAGLAISERRVEHAEVGESPRHLTDIVLGVLRDGALHRVDDGTVDPLAAGDRLLCLRKTSPDDNGTSTTC
jgi:voltage-gated potassium channel